MGIKNNRVLQNRISLEQVQNIFKYNDRFLDVSRPDREHVGAHVANPGGLGQTVLEDGHLAGGALGAQESPAVAAAKEREQELLAKRSKTSSVFKMKSAAKHYKFKENYYLSVPRSPSPKK